MVTKSQVRKLQQDMKSELSSSIAAVCKCGACLVVLVLIALIGSTSESRDVSGAGYRLGGRIDSVPQQISAVAAAGSNEPEQDGEHLQLVKQDR